MFGRNHLLLYLKKPACFLTVFNAKHIDKNSLTHFCLCLCAYFFLRKNGSRIDGGEKKHSKGNG